jgi:hypothetical protein
MRKVREHLMVYIVTGLFALALFLFNDSSGYIKASYIITFYLCAKLIQDLGSKVPFATLMLFITAFQYLVAPALDYEYLGPYNPYFKMRLPKEQFFSYVLYAFLALWAGFSIPMGRARKDSDFILALKHTPKENAKAGIALICVGFAATYLSLLISFPTSLGFIITLVTLMRFVGLLFIWLSDHKYKKWIIIGVIAEFTLYILASAILIHLIILAIFLYSYFALVNKPNKLKIIGLGAISIVVLFFVQSVKPQYRDQVWRKGKTEDRFGLFTDLLTNKIGNMDKRDFLFTAATVNLRINQGWVMQLIMDYLPKKKPFLHGAVIEDELLGLLLPRFVLIDKASVQTSEKFEKFAGYKLRGYTISVGILGDGYGNFGVEGGIAFCFCVGLFFNFCIFLFRKISEKNPSVYLWGIFIFFYLIRAGDDFYIISNWLIKSSMMLAVIYFLFKGRFVIPYLKINLRKKRIFTSARIN